MSASTKLTSSSQRGMLETVKLGLRRVGVKMRSIEHVAEHGVEA